MDKTGRWRAIKEVMDDPLYKWLPPFDLGLLN